jgi:opacity protein-like surface antigen
VNGWLRGGLTICGLAALIAAPGRLDAQFIDIRFVAIDMFGGAVWPDESEVGVAFGGRLGFADLFGRTLHMGFELDWWSADRKSSDLAVRDAMGGLAFWVDVVRRGGVRPYLGAGVSLHSIDVSRFDDSGSQGGQLLGAERLDGVRFGASGLLGVALRLTATGAIWLLAEYRYTAISEIPYHEARLGFRLFGSGS